MATAQWLDYGRTLTKALIEYQEVISLASGNMINIIMTFGSILAYTDLLILSSSESPDRYAVLEGAEVRRLAQDTITRATNIRDLMHPIYLKSQRGLSEIKEMMNIVAAAATLSPTDLELFVQKLEKIAAIIEQIRAQAEYLLPATIATQELARLLKKRVEKLSVSVGHYYSHIYQDKTEWHSFPCASLQVDAESRETDHDRLILLTNQKRRDN